MHAEVGDATELHAGREGAAVVFSSFGLQQLAAAAPQALASWVRCLAPGGVAVVVFWPSNCELHGPWGAYDAAVRKLQDQQKQQATETAPGGAAAAPGPAAGASGSTPAAGRELQEWERSLTGPALAVPGVRLVSDEVVEHEMRWPDVDSLWKVRGAGEKETEWLGCVH